MSQGPSRAIPQLGIVKMSHLTGCTVISKTGLIICCWHAPVVIDGPVEVDNQAAHKVQLINKCVKEPRMVVSTARKVRVIPRDVQITVIDQVIADAVSAAVDQGGMTLRRKPHNHSHHNEQKYPFHGFLPRPFGLNTYHGLVKRVGNRKAIIGRDRKPAGSTRRRESPSRGRGTHREPDHRSGHSSPAAGRASNATRLAAGGGG